MNRNDEEEEQARGDEEEETEICFRFQILLYIITIIVFIVGLYHY